MVDGFLEEKEELKRFNQNKLKNLKIQVDLIRNLKIQKLQKEMKEMEEKENLKLKWEMLREETINYEEK